MLKPPVGQSLAMLLNVEKGEAVDSDKHTSLSQNDINYVGKKFYFTGL
jgi:hypothetical protein